ncbi:MAG: carboxypeptidase-like regulatory domain-containing protein, partial [candidate division Zixibacteria bacterium]|nr:carboxypeptidase-like regulatory domain-containing protein [candidate division Zixibacteria bacterium]
MLIGIMVTFVCLFNPIFSQSEKRYTISGYVKDSSSGEALIGASIYVEQLKAGCSSNTYGFYSLTLPEGSHDLAIRMVGY